MGWKTKLDFQSALRGYHEQLINGVPLRALVFTCIHLLSMRGARVTLPLLITTRSMFEARSGGNNGSGLNTMASAMIDYEISPRASRPKHCYARDRSFNPLIIATVPIGAHDGCFLLAESAVLVKFAIPIGFVMAAESDLPGAFTQVASSLPWNLSPAGRAEPYRLTLGGFL